MIDFAAAVSFQSPTLKLHRAAVAVLVAATTSAVVAPLVAQTSGRQARTVEPQLTRLFGSDSMEMSSPALSPDGRWIVFSRQEAQKSNLWFVSAAGGEPVPLPTGPYSNLNPVFFSSGDRIAFLSDRPSAPGDQAPYVMVMPFDPRTGRSTGIPRQVSLERVSWPSLAVSPDGEWIAYAARADTPLRLMVVPSTGGTARALAEFGGSTAYISNLAWSGDGRFVYFGLRRSLASDIESVLRAPLARGPTQELGRGRRLRQLGGILPDRGLMLLRVALWANAGQQRSYEIATLEGRTVASFQVPSMMGLSGRTPDGRGFVASRSNIVAPIRIVPVAGGPARQLTDAREYDWPYGWSPDGSALYVQTRMNGNDAVLRMPVDGGPASHWPIPSDRFGPIGITPDGRFVSYHLASTSDDAATMVIRRLADGQTRVVTRAAVWAPGILPIATGAGGTRTSDGEFFYLERRGGRLELRSTPPEEPSRLLRAFPLSYAGRTSFGVYGTRIAYTERRGDSSAVFVAEGPNGRPHQLVTVAGSATHPAWSHDGRWLALDHTPPGQGSRYRVLLLGIGPDGTLRDPPRVLEAGLQWGGPPSGCRTTVRSRSSGGSVSETRTTCSWFPCEKGSGQSPSRGTIPRRAGGTRCLRTAGTWPTPPRFPAAARSGAWTSATCWWGGGVRRRSAR
jgi:Tol biopolymer transport system component